MKRIAGLFVVALAILEQGCDLSPQPLPPGSNLSGHASGPTGEIPDAGSGALAVGDAGEPDASEPGRRLDAGVNSVDGADSSDTGASDAASDSADGADSSDTGASDAASDSADAAEVNDASDAD
jgi:hypothetical protein